MIRALLFYLLLVLGTGRAMASDDWRLSGFGTLGGLVVNDSRLSLLRSGISMPGRDSPDYGVDSILGLQASRTLGRGNDLTAQLILRENQTGEVEPRLAWAFLRLTPLSDIELRLGRLRAPFFMYSDSLWINYANPWIRPPVEVYGLNPFSDLDGADLMWRSRIDEYDLEVRPFLGRSRLELPNRNARLKRVYGVNFALHRDQFSLQLGHGESPFGLPWGDPIFRSVDATLRRAGLARIAAEMSGDDGYARFDSIGVQWDGGKYLLSAEFARRSVNRYITSAHGWQLTAGRRWGPWSGYLTLARQDLDQPVVDADLSTVPPLQAGLEAFLESRNSAQRSATFGVRWDFHRNAALKLELTRARIDRGSWGSFFPVEDSGLISLGGRKLNLFAASIDLSF